MKHKTTIHVLTIIYIFLYLTSVSFAALPSQNDLQGESIKFDLSPEIGKIYTYGICIERTKSFNSRISTKKMTSELSLTFHKKYEDKYDMEIFYSNSNTETSNAKQTKTLNEISKITDGVKIQLTIRDTGEIVSINNIKNIRETINKSANIYYKNLIAAGAPTANVSRMRSSFEKAYENEEFIKITLLKELTIILTIFSNNFSLSNEIYFTATQSFPNIPIPVVTNGSYFLQKTDEPNKYNLRIYAEIEHESAREVESWIDSKNISGKPIPNKIIELYESGDFTIDQTRNIATSIEYRKSSNIHQMIQVEKISIDEIVN